MRHSRKFSGTFAAVIVLSCLTASISANDLFRFNAKGGFAAEEDMIVEHQLVDDGRKLILVGEKFIQVWDVEGAKLVSSTPHGIPQFAPVKGFVSKYLLLGLPKILKWQPYLIDPQGKWLATIEKATPDKPFRSAVIRDVTTAKRIAVLELPNVSMDYISYDAGKGEILTFGQAGQAASFVNWNKETFKPRLVLAFDDYEWHQTIRNGTKMIVGSGDSKGVGWLKLGVKQGDKLTLRDVKTGAVEKEFTAKGLLPRTPFQDTALSEDEKHLYSQRDDRLFVWEIDGDGQPKFEIVSVDPRIKPRLETFAGRRYLVVSVDQKLAVYDIAGDGKPNFTISPKAATEDVDFLDASADDGHIAAEDEREILVLKAIGKGEPVFRILRQSLNERLYNVNFIDGGRYLSVTRVNRKEKKPVRTELFDPATGKVVFDIPIAIGVKPTFTSDKRYLYSTELGVAMFWDFAEKRAFCIPLETYTPSTTNSDGTTNNDSSYNVERIDLSPDEKYVLRYGDDTVTVFDMATGHAVQSIFDNAKVKYDKKSRVKRSGLGDAGWALGGRVVYAFDKDEFFGKRRMVSFWTRSN